MGAKHKLKNDSYGTITYIPQAKKLNKNTEKLGRTNFLRLLPSEIHMVTILQFQVFFSLYTGRRFFLNYKSSVFSLIQHFVQERSTTKHPKFQLVITKHQLLLEHNSNSPLSKYCKRNTEFKMRRRSKASKRTASPRVHSLGQQFGSCVGF